MIEATNKTHLLIFTLLMSSQAKFWLYFRAAWNFYAQFSFQKPFRNLISYQCLLQMFIVNFDDDFIVKVTYLNYIRKPHKIVQSPLTYYMQ